MSYLVIPISEVFEATFESLAVEKLMIVADGGYQDQSFDYLLLFGSDLFQIDGKLDYNETEMLKYGYCIDDDADDEKEYMIDKHLPARLLR